MDELMVLRQSHPQLSLRRFAQYAEIPYWRLRDHQHSAPVRCARQQHRDELYEQVRQTALLHPTSGYRLLYQELKAQGQAIGLHQIRVALGELQLHPPQPRKTRNPSSKVSSPQDWPEGRRIQIDATRLSLPDGVCWIYFVLDVLSRVVLASRVVRSLSMHLAKLTLDDAVAVLRAEGHPDTILIQSDGGSDFTGDIFQQGCLKYGSWVRSKVSQPGGTGILERLNRTYKWVIPTFGAMALPETGACLIRAHYQDESVGSAAPNTRPDSLEPALPSGRAEDLAATRVERTRRPLPDLSTALKSPA